MSESDNVPLAQRRVSVSATSRLSNLTSTSTTSNTLDKMLAGSRKMSTVDATARLTVARNNVDSTKVIEITTPQELKGWFIYDFANGAFFYR